MVVGIVMTVAVPSFQNITRDTRAVANANELVTALSLARSEAVRRSGRVSVCRSSDGATCTGTWASGWIVFRDTAAADDTDPPVVGEVLRVWPAPTGNSAVTPNPADTTWIRFLPRGNARNTTGVATVTFNIVVQGCSGQQARAVEVNAIGRASVSRVACPREPNP